MPAIIQPKSIADQPSSSTSVKIPDPRLPTFTNRDLLKFEFNFLTESELARCEELFKEGNFTEPNPIYQSWLRLKLASLPTEVGALQDVLASHSPHNIPKRRKVVKRDEPIGAARFNPISDEWVNILETRESTDAVKKQNVSISAASEPLRIVEPDIKKTFECLECGKFYSTKGSLRTHKYQHQKKAQEVQSPALQE